MQKKTGKGREMIPLLFCLVVLQEQNQHPQLLPHPATASTNVAIVVANPPQEEAERG